MKTFEVLYTVEVKRVAIIEAENKEDAMLRFDDGDTDQQLDICEDQLAVLNIREI